MPDSDLDLQRRLASIDAMLHPRSIAIVGASERLQYGGRFVNNLLMTGCGARLYPVNPKRDAIFGVPCCHTIGEIPEPVDLAALIIPGSRVIEALRECAEMGARSALVISAGFAELGTEEGIARQRQLRALARETGVRVCGPNCIGLANVAESVWATSTSRISRDAVPSAGGIGLVSQSGATCFGPLIAIARDRGIGLRYLVSSGNEADLELCDYVDYMLRDPEVKVVAALVEGFRDGASFVRVAEGALEAGKPLVVLKIGRSEVGNRAAGSHTGAMTGSDVVHDALFKQKGVVRVDDYDELMETAGMFARARVPRGGRVGVVSHSGGIGSMAADKMGELGLEMPPLSAETRDGLRRIMGERGVAANPADVTGFANSERFPEILALLLADRNLDLLVVASAGRAPQARAVMEAAETSEKPILFQWTDSVKEASTLPTLQAAPHLPVFYLPEKCAKGVRRLIRYHATRERLLAARAREDALPPGAPPHAMAADGVGTPPAVVGAGVPAGPREPLTGDLETLRGMLARAGEAPLTEYESKRALALFGLPITRETLCIDVKEALEAAELIGYPVALKVVSPQISHKTEAGAVRLGIAGAEALAVAAEEMLASVRSRYPGARVDGLLVQEMVSEGVEVIVGVSRDPQFGPVLMLGLGGILVEALGAASWRVCPIGPEEAGEMIREVRGLSRILAGFRGRPKADREALVDALVRISRLAMWVGDEVSSLDINPLAVLPEGRGVVALDALIVTARTED